MRYLRFAVRAKDEDSGVRLGFFQVAHELADAGRLPEAEARELSVVLAWFASNLATPTRFSRTRDASHKRTRAVSWFKDTAVEHIKFAWEIVAILHRQRVVIDALETDRPGSVVYEDPHQVVAEAFADTLA